MTRRNGKDEDSFTRTFDNPSYDAAEGDGFDTYDDAKQDDMADGYMDVPAANGDGYMDVMPQ